MTPLSTLRGEGRRELQETTIGGASGAVAVFARIGAEHELRRVDRDDILASRIAGGHLLNRNAGTGLEHEQIVPRWGGPLPPPLDTLGLK